VPQAGILQQDGTVYAGTVAYNVGKLNITATATHPNARVVKILDNGMEKPVDAANSVSFQLDAPGTGQSKTITVKVIAEDGTPGDNTINIFNDDSKITYYAEGGIVNLIKKDGTENEYYEIHTFMAAPGTSLGGQTEYTLNFTQKPADNKVEVLVVAGGGGGGKGDTGGHRAGGGGAGRFIYDSAYDIGSNDSFDVKVGAGGAVTTDTGNNGADSEFGSDFVAKGGGGGGHHKSNNRSDGKDGGSGGGSTGQASSYYSAALTGTAPAGALNLGNVGALGGYGYSGGGGGGAGGAGETPTGAYKGANGGTGTQSAISGALSWYAGGGAGGAEDLYNNGDQYGAGQGNPGEAGTGDGGSGGGGNEAKLDGGNGGSGIVIVRWPWIEPESTQE
jgi:hypothetical protein